jgi:hypothetical protein
MRHADPAKGNGVIRQLFNAACALSLLLCVATIVLSARSGRHAILYDFHRRDGTPWQVSIRDGWLFMENQSALRLRALKANEQEASPLRARASQLRSQWQQRPGRFEKSKDGFVDQMVEAELQAQAAEQRGISLQLELERELRRGTFVPAISRSIRGSVLAEAALLLPFAWVVWAVGERIRRARLRRTGHCVRCGYDLRANNDRCPECGMPIPMKATI